MKIKQLIQALLVGLFCLVSLSVHTQDLHRKNADLPCFDKNFNVVVHIAVDSLNRNPVASEALVNTMMTEVSEFFNPICMSFSACEILIIEDNYSYSNLQNAPIPVSQRIQKMEALFNKERRINVFVVDSIQNIECGYGNINGILTEKNANVVIELYNCPDSRPSQSLAHQLGHLFGLYDTYNMNSPLELVDGSNCETAGDFLIGNPIWAISCLPTLANADSPENSI